MQTRLLVGIVLGISMPLACAREPEWEDMRRGATDCIVVVFADETSASEIGGFLEEHTHGPRHPGGGYTLKAEVGSVIRRDVEGQAGYEICFQKDADPVRISAIQGSLQASPLPARIVVWDSEEQVYREVRVHEAPDGESGS